MIQILSDVFGAPVSTGEVPNSAALGGAFKAFHGWYIANVNRNASSQSLAAVVEPFTAAFGLRVAATPNVENTKVYEEMAKRYALLEQNHIRPL